MPHKIRFLALCTIAVLTVSCSDSNQPTSSSSPTSAVIARLAPCASIGDRVWLDLDCEGDQDKDEVNGGFTEPGVPDVTVNLYTCEGAFVATTTTDANGFYVFNDLEDTESFRVCFVLPPGYSFAPVDQGPNDGLDSDAGADGCAPCISPNECETIRGIDAGLCREDTPEPCASIGDRVWLDEDCEGDQDKDEGGFTEPGVPDVTVNLYACDGALVATTTTDADGFYLFSNVDDTIDYRVCFVLPAGYSFAPKDAAGGNDGIDSDAGADGCTDCFGLDECEDRRDVDAGLCREEEEEGEGCTPGFWKNHYTHWAATGYSPDDVFDEVFGCEIFGDDTTLGEAVHVELMHNVLAFHGVAALLNANHPGVDYAYDEGEVIAFVCDGNKDALADANEEGCPLSGGNTTGGGGGGGKKKD